MKRLYDYIIEKKDDKKDEEKSTVRGDIKFTIWKSPKNQVTWLEDDENYQKIEYQYTDKENDINIDFLLGKKDDKWHLWIGKIGVCSYNDDPYYDFDTGSFKKAIVMSLDKVEEFIDNVKKDPTEYSQYVSGV